MFENPPSPFRPFVGRRVLVAFIGIALTYTVAYVIQEPAIQIPGYLLIVSFGTVVSAAPFDLTGLAFDVAFGIYLYVLAVVAAEITRVFGRRTQRSRHEILDAVAGTLLVLGIVGVFVAVILAIAIPNAVACDAGGCAPVSEIDWTPVFIVLATSFAFLGGGTTVAHRRRYA